MFIKQFHQIFSCLAVTLSIDLVLFELRSLHLEMCQTKPQDGAVGVQNSFLGGKKS